MERLALTGLVGVGHSAGATTLARVAAGNRARFRRLVLIDPILFDPVGDADYLADENPMAARTRNRRLVWSSRDEMYASYRHRPPYETWTETALRTYVTYGSFDRPDGEVELWCPGRIEAQIYENAGRVSAFEALRKVDVPVLVVRGEHSDSFHADRAQRALNCLPAGRLVTIDGTSHYIPMEEPRRVAQLVLAEFKA
jgi:pimeloyl-ACP methyl ester carboxylesterase